MVHIEIVYSTAEKKVICMHCQLPEGSTVGDALNLSGFWQAHPETKDLALGIFSKIVSLHTVLRDGDRIEIYRPLTNDPKDKRRQRAKSS